jgi:hypothetical protein
MMELYCDSVLKYLKTLKRNDIVDSEEVLKQTTVLKEYLPTALTILLHKGFIEYEHPASNFFRITNSGIEFISTDSFEKIANKKKYEAEKLKADLELAQRQLSDYETKYKNEKRMKQYALATVVIEALLLLLSNVKR